MNANNYPTKITIDIDARLHLQHIDRPASEHYIQKVTGNIISYPNEGTYEVTLQPANGVRFSQITSGPMHLGDYPFHIGLA